MSRWITSLLYWRTVIIRHYIRSLEQVDSVFISRKHRLLFVFSMIHFRRLNTDSTVAYEHFIYNI